MASYETIEQSTCCGAEVRTKLVGDETYDICDNCERQCETEEVCAECFGDATVPVMAPVYAGEPHMADVGTKTCICQKGRDDREFSPEQEAVIERMTAEAEAETE